MPPPFPGEPPKKGKGPLFWTLIGCAGLIVLIIGFIAISSFLLMQRARHAGLDPELARRNPALFAARMMVAATPGVEVVRVDENSGKMTLREKETGKEVTLDFDDVKNGRIVFRNDKGERVVVQGGGVNGPVQIQTKEGEVQVGGSAKAPGWVPMYPGAKVVSVISGRNTTGEGGVLTLATSDPPAKVADYLEAELKKGGFEVTRESISEALITLSATDKEGRTVKASVTPAEQTTVSIAYESK